VTENRSPLSFTVSEEDAGQRLDHYLTDKVDGASRSALTRMVRERAITVNGKPSRKAGLSLNAGDEVMVRLGPPSDAKVGESTVEAPQVVFEDEHVMAIDKPAGVAVHPGPGHLTDTLIERLLALGTPLSKTGGEERPGIVHRLDKDTSGVMLIAKTDIAHEALSSRFVEREVKKTYLTLLRGNFRPEEGVIEAPIARDPRNRQRMSVVRGGREARTAFTVAGRIGGYSLVVARPETGRPHQIRIHFASMGHPVAGDGTYGRGGAPEGLRRMFLHALRLAFDHPMTNEPIVAEVALPSDLDDTLRTLAGSDYEPLMAKALQDT
jgi:23S rRNA pseudouridine1911/1915/1917 synthase